MDTLVTLESKHLTLGKTFELRGKPLLVTHFDFGHMFWTGFASNKKEARNEAARRAWEDLGLLPN